MFKLAALRQEDDDFRQLADQLRTVADYDLRLLKQVFYLKDYRYIIRNEDVFCMTYLLDDLYKAKAVGEFKERLSLSDLSPIYFNGGNKPTFLWSKL